METSLLLPVLVRWLHVVTAVVAVGGLVFIAFVLRPAASRALDDRAHAALRDAVMGRWRVVVMLAVALLFISGMVTLVTESMEKAQDVPAYHPLFGIKFLLALVVFFFASVLAGRSPAFEKLRQNAPRWTAITAVLALLVVMIAGLLASIA